LEEVFLEAAAIYCAIYLLGGESEKRQLHFGIEKPSSSAALKRK